MSTGTWRPKPSARDVLRFSTILAVGLVPHVAHAQLDTGSGLMASKKINIIPPADFGAPPIPHPEALFPQVNDFLSHYGTAILLDNVDEFSGIVSGAHGGSGNAGQYALEWDQDWNTLANIRGLQTHVITVGRYGNLASPQIGEQLTQSQEIYGAGGNVAVHLVEAYGEETAAHGRFNLAAGRMPSTNDFNSNPLFCNFETIAVCGVPAASLFNAATVSYPDSNWAARLRLRFIPNLYVQSAIFFTQDNNYGAISGNRSGFNFDSNHINGQYFPTEIGYSPVIGSERLPGHYKVGFGYDNENHTIFTPGTLASQVRKGGTGTWVQFDQMISRQGPGDTDGTILFGDYVHNDPRYSLRSSQYILGVVSRDFWRARPLDTIDALVSYTQVSGQLTRAQEIEQEFGLPLSGAFSRFPGAQGVQSNSIDFELNYQIHVFRGVTFAPVFQYYIRPNAERSLPDAALLGFKSHIELF